MMGIARKRLIVIAVIATVAAAPMGGFVFGFLHCTDCGFNVFGRMFVGLVFAVLTPLSGGFPPQDEAGVSASLNAWPYIGGTWLVIVLLLAAREHRRGKKQE
jgi:hypothetical protein